jgi:hypothetical protein
VSFLHAAIAPCYEIDFNGLNRDREGLASIVYQIGSENILTCRIRMQNDMRLIDMIDRELRFACLGAINVSIGEYRVACGDAGFTHDESLFRAVSTGLTLEVASQGWRVRVSGRQYNAAAPGVESWRIGLADDRVWGRAFT